MLTEFYNFLRSFTVCSCQKGSYSSGNWQQQVRAEALRLSRDKKGRFLEVGCGEGLFLTELAQGHQDCEVWGIDTSRQRLDELNSSAGRMNLFNVRTVCLGGETMDFADGYFDAVICVNVLFNLESKEKVTDVLGQIRRVLRPAGSVIFDFRNAANPFLNLKYLLAPIYDRTVKGLPLKTYTFREINGLLIEIGFKITSSAYLGFALKQFAPIVVIEAAKV